MSAVTAASAGGATPGPRPGRGRAGVRARGCGCFCFCRRARDARQKPARDGAAALPAAMGRNGRKEKGCASPSLPGVEELLPRQQARQSDEIAGASHPLLLPRPGPCSTEPRRLRRRSRRARPKSSERLEECLEKHLECGADQKQPDQKPSQLTAPGRKRPAPSIPEPGLTQSRLLNRAAPEGPRLQHLLYTEQVSTLCKFFQISFLKNIPPQSKLCLDGNALGFKANLSFQLEILQYFSLTDKDFKNIPIHFCQKDKLE